MTRKYILIFSLLFIFFICIFYVLTYGLHNTGQKPGMIEMSVIVRGQSDRNWTTIKQGIDQAATDLNVDVSFITLGAENDLSEQKALMEREVANGAAAVVVAAADSNGLASLVDSLAEEVPIVAIESNVNSAKLTDYISGNNYEMGAALAVEIAGNGISNRNIAIIDGASRCENMLERQRGITQALNAAGRDVQIVSVSNDLSNVAETVLWLIEQNSTGTLIVPDPATLEIVAQTINVAQPIPNIRVYGFGATGLILSYLEQGIISEIVVQNDFSIGYLGIAAAVNATRGNDTGKNAFVGYKIITGENMYDSNTQRLLFPYIR